MHKFYTPLTTALTLIHGFSVLYNWTIGPKITRTNPRSQKKIGSYLAIIVTQIDSTKWISGFGHLVEHSERCDVG